MNRILKRGVPVLLGVCLVAGLCSQAQAVLQTSPYLPPGMGEYIGQQHAMYPQEVLLTEARHKRFTNIQRTQVGADEQETFDSVLTGNVTFMGTPLGSKTLTGPVTVMVRNYTSGQTGTFATEIVSMSLSGNVGGAPVAVRESPTLASVGSTTITDLGGGMYDIDSFFDVFTELSFMGGPYMADVTGAARMTLTPEPAALSLLALGGLAVLRRRR